MIRHWQAQKSMARPGLACGREHRPPAAGPAASAPSAGAAHSVDRRRHLGQWTRSSNLSVDDGRRITEGQYGPYKKVRGIRTLQVGPRC